MADHWIATTLNQAVEINPSRQLMHGTLATHVAMDQIPRFQRAVSDVAHREYGGSGARFMNGDTLVARITPCLENGKTVFVNFLSDGEVGWGSTEFIVLSGKANSTDSLFVYYLACSQDFREFAIKHMEGTSGRQRVPAVALGRYGFVLPPLDEQKRIAAILGTFDDKIELNRRMNETLEAMARALFQSWFVDFDPVHAKAAVRRQHPTWSNAQLSRAALPNLNPEIAELFPDRFEESAIGEIPAGWSCVPVPEAIDVNPPRSLPKGTIAAWLEMSNMPTASARALAWEMREFGSGTKFINGDTLVARITPCLENGKTAYVDFLSDGQVAAGSTEYIILRPKPPQPPTFAYFLARNENFRQHLITNMTGTSGRQRAPADCLNSYFITVPPAAIADLFGRTAEGSIAQMKANDEESTALAASRDALLPRLLATSSLPEGAIL